MMDEAYPARTNARCGFSWWSDRWWTRVHCHLPAGHGDKHISGTGSEKDGFAWVACGAENMKYLEGRWE